MNRIIKALFRLITDKRSLLADLVADYCPDSHLSYNPKKRPPQPEKVKRARRITGIVI